MLCFKTLQNLSEAAPTSNTGVGRDGFTSTWNTNQCFRFIHSGDNFPKAQFFCGLGAKAARKSVVSNLTSQCRCTLRKKKKERKKTCEGCWSLYPAYVATGTLCSYCKVFEDTLSVCSKPSLSCRSSAAGSYITVLITATRITCSALSDTHSSSSRLPSIRHYLLIPASFVSSPLHRGYFNLSQLSALLNALFPFCLFSLSVAASSLFALFIGVTLAGSQNSQLLLTLSPLVRLFLSFFTVLSISRHLSALIIWVSLSPSLSLSLRLGSSSNITNAIAYWLGAKSARR